MNLPFYVRLESGLLLNLSQLSVIHPRQPNGSIRVQSVGCPALIVISPTTEADEQNIQAAISLLQDCVVRELGLTDEPASIHQPQGPRADDDSTPSPMPSLPRTKNKPKNGRRRNKAAA